jgi:hypothetical protein
MSGNEDRTDGKSPAHDNVVNIYEGNDPILQEDMDHEKVVRVFSDLQSIETLKFMIRKIEADELRNFIVIAQCDNNEKEEKVTGNEKGVTFYFYGQDTCITLVGLADRIKHILNEYMDGNFNFFDEL